MRTYNLTGNKHLIKEAKNFLKKTKEWLEHQDTQNKEIHQALETLRGTTALHLQYQGHNKQTGEISQEKNQIAIRIKIGKTNAETRFVLGHELSHYLLGHLKPEEITIENFWSQKPPLRAQIIYWSHEYTCNHLTRKILGTTHPFPGVILYDPRLRTTESNPTIKRILNLLKNTDTQRTNTKTPLHKSIVKTRFCNKNRTLPIKGLIENLKEQTNPRKTTN